MTGPARLELIEFLVDLALYVPASADDRSELLLIAAELILTSPPVQR